MPDIFDKFKHILKGRPAAPSGPVEYIIAGLGNPGREYENTRHNAGFLALDRLAGQLDCSVVRLKFRSLCGDAVIAGRRVLLMKPSTYMNKSGEAVRDALAFHKLGPESLLVFSDDVALDIGRMRIRRGGSDGGQKGLANIIYLTGRDDFVRVRIGVGEKPHPEMQLADWVLSRFGEKDAELLDPVLENCAIAAELIVQGKINEAMNRFN